MKSNPLIEITRHGQSIWLDNLARPLIEQGGLASLIENDGVTGITSNPAIFQKAMTAGHAYDRQIRDLASQGRTSGKIYEALAIEDIRGAADLLRPAYEGSKGADGFVSLEVSPHLARETQGTIGEAVRLWKEVDRPNIFIKIPGTSEGLPAIEECLFRGINVNITLLFSIPAHREVIEAHFRAMERRRAKGEPLGTVASVASYFLSRIDVKVDKQLDRMIEAGDRAEPAHALRGRTAVASAKLAYRMWKKMMASDRWKALEKAGARIQKPLWASTSTKDPSMSDVKYIEALIGPHTVNTMPDETLEAFRDHGKVAPTLEQDIAGEERVLQGLAAVGIDIDQVTAELVEEGIDKFIKPFDSLLASLETKRQALLKTGA